MIWVLFAVLANLLYSFANIIDQLLRREHVKDNVALTILWVAFSALILLAVVPFIGITVPAASQLAAALVAGVIAVMVAIPYFYSLSVEEVSKVMPVWQFSALFVLAMAALFLGESLLARHYYGFAAMLLGGLLLAVDKGIDGFGINRALLLVFGASIAWAVYLILVKFVYATETFWNGFFWVFLGNLLGAFVLAVFPKNFGRLKGQLSVLTRRGFALILATTVVSLVADLLFMFAISSGPVSLVSVIGSTQAMFVFVMAVFISKYFPSVIKERIDRKTLLTKAVAILLIMAGLYLIR